MFYTLLTYYTAHYNKRNGGRDNNAQKKYFDNIFL